MKVVKTKDPALYDLLMEKALSRLQEIFREQDRREAEKRKKKR